MRNVMIIGTKRAVAEALQHNTARFAFKAEEKRQFTGLASTWDLDQGGDVIEAGAYSRTLREIKSTGRVVPLINQHQYYDARNAIGKMVSAKQTDAGLETTFQVVNSTEGDEFLARIKDGILDGLSIGYEVRGWRAPTDAERKRGVERVLTDIELREVSLVIWGMNQNALIDSSSVKSLAQTLSQMKRESLTDDDRKTVRLIASQCGQLLRPLTAGEEKSEPPVEDEQQSDDPPPAPPGDPADAPKADTLSAEATDALRRDILAFQIRQTINA